MTSIWKRPFWLSRIGVLLLRNWCGEVNAGRRLGGGVGDLTGSDSRLRIYPVRRAGGGMSSNAWVRRSGRLCILGSRIPKPGGRPWLTGSSSWGMNSCGRRNMNVVGRRVIVNRIIVTGSMLVLGVDAVAGRPQMSLKGAVSSAFLPLQNLLIESVLRESTRIALESCRLRSVKGGVDLAL